MADSMGIDAIKHNGPTFGSRSKKTAGATGPEAELDKLLSDESSSGSSSSSNLGGDTFTRRHSGSADEPNSDSIGASGKGGTGFKGRVTALFAGKKWGADKTGASGTDASNTSSTSPETHSDMGLSDASINGSN